MISLISKVPMFRNAIAMAVLFVLDHLIAKKTKARWFALHFLANFLVVMASALPLWTCITDPFNCGDSRIYSDTSFFGNSSKWPVIIVNAIHVYHVVAFPLTADERFHHYLFIPTVGFMGQTFEWGSIVGSLAFFISGLPGGIEYLMLVLVKHGTIPIIRQKRVSAVLNVYLRGPCIVITSFLTYQSFIYEKTTVPPLVAFTVISMSLFNSLYYTKQSVANFSISHALNRVKRMDSCNLSQDVMKDKGIKEPQSSMS